MDIVHVAAIASSLHLLALGIGLPSIFLRSRTLAGPLDESGLGRLFAADTIWGVAALLWISTGLLRAFGGLEKGTQFYLNSQLFWVKMGLLGTILLLEIWPMTTFIKWRIGQGRGEVLDTSRQHSLLMISRVQLGLVIAMVFVASLMARGIELG
jgi:putative membrane protein